MEKAKELDQQLMRLLRRAAHLHLEGKSGEPGRVRGQGRILVVLMKNGALSGRELCDLVERRPATLSEQLDLMEAAGLVLRQKSDSDRRSIIVSLTEKGMEMAKQAEESWNRNAKNVFAPLSQDEKRQLLALLGKLEQGWAQREESEPE